MIFSETELNDLLTVIRRLGAIHVFPGGNAEQKVTYRGCVELEKKGTVYKAEQGLGFVVYKALGKPVPLTLSTSEVSGNAFEIMVLLPEPLPSFHPSAGPAQRIPMLLAIYERFTPSFTADTEYRFREIIVR